MRIVKLLGHIHTSLAPGATFYRRNTLESFVFTFLSNPSPTPLNSPHKFKCANFPHLLFEINTRSIFSRRKGCLGSQGLCQIMTRIRQYMEGFTSLQLPKKYPHGHCCCLSNIVGFSSK